MRYARKKFTICSCYDTETTNIGNGIDTRAFPVLFIDNDLRDRPLYDYEPGDDKINFYRYGTEYIDRIKEYIQWGLVIGKVPIVCAYNLMFDLKPIIYELNNSFDIKVNAQSGMNVYTVDLYEQDTDIMLLRFWDTFHLEMRGLNAMGETAGLEKAVGDWDYSLIRTPETPLTDEELFYAGRDTQVIPMYLRYLLHANEWMKQDDLGVRVITKTSIVRQMARREIGSIYVGKRNGKRLSLDKAFIEKCLAQRPQTFNQYALRKACFRGGFTFTSAAYAGTIQHNVVSLDVTSMHHTFINGRKVPEDFRMVPASTLQPICERIVNVSVSEVLEHYEQPLFAAIHARIKFTNIRLRHDSCFEHYGLALLSTSKFKREAIPGTDIGEDPREVAQTNVINGLGWHDTMRGGTVAFGKLYEAQQCVLDLSELELWCVGQVYEWDYMEVLFGEYTTKFRLPPDFVTLQSNELFEMKSKAKYISKHYMEGIPYEGSLDGIPDGIATELRNGTCPAQFFESWYTGTVKGMFNGIYGTQAQDVYKPSYKCVDGELVVDLDTRTTPENYDTKNDISTLRVLYTYGLRIVGGSRMHMVISMELIYDAFGNKVRVLGGDTDSMKCSVDECVTDDMLDSALEPIAAASERAISVSMERVRCNWPDKASNLNGVGSFDIENRGEHYGTHLELWNKCRVSWDGKAHVTCAGLSRPIGTVNIETVIETLSRHYPIDDVLMACIGYNVCIEASVSHSLESHIPDSSETIGMSVTDYMGNESLVDAHQSISLYPSARWLGETLKPGNLASVNYVRSCYGRNIDTDYRYVGFDGTKVYVKKETSEGLQTIMEAYI